MDTFRRPTPERTRHQRIGLAFTLSLAALSALASLLLAAPAGALTTPGSSGRATAQSDGAEQAGQRLPTRGPVDTTPGDSTEEGLDLVGGLLFGKPIIDGDFADPYALSEPDGVYVYATNTVSANIPVLELPKGATNSASYRGDALPTLPSWTSKGFQWAPSVWARPDGTFVMYYTTPEAKGGTKQCISRATSKSPVGPFTDDSTSAFICPLSQGGAIDPSIFIDDGTPYLLWKTDGDCCALPTNIFSQKLSSDGLSVAGDPTKLIGATQSWEKDLIEGPSMVRQGDRYFLFYSANDWDTNNYAIGAATCEAVTGPCTKTIDRPWMRSTEFSKGPGGQEFFPAPTGSGIWMVHHGWLPGEAGTTDGQRRLYLDRISFSTGAALPQRSGAAAIEEALFEDAAFLALAAGLVVGVAVVALAWFRKRRQPSAGGSATIS